MEKLIGTKSELIKQILDLKFEDNDFLKAEITRIKDKKTLQQNRYMWSLIDQIAQKQNR